jgi:REP element-mobilizing transposase RayT
MKNRKRNRLSEFDYSSDGYYFITTCVKNRKNYFGIIENNKMILNKYGKIVMNCWLDLPRHYLNCKLDEFIIMPNHFHGIIFIENNEKDLKKHNISEFIRAFKTFSSRKINYLLNGEKFQWQKSFYDNIIRNEKSLTEIRNYIIHNPLNWKDDEYF